MKIETLRKNHKKEIIIGGLIGLGLTSVLIFIPSQAKYKLTESIKIGTGEVNYKVPDFQAIAMYQSVDGDNYTEITEMPIGSYAINEEKTYCTTDNVTKVKGKIKTIGRNHVINNLKKNEKCYLYFDKTISITDIMSNLTIKTATPDFTQIADTDEGVFKISDGMYGGESYYWRGAVTNNHVIFANLCWRIVRINGDNSVRLIYNGTPSNGICAGNGKNEGSIAETSQKYNISIARSEYVGYTYTEGSQRGTTTPSNLKSVTETWFNSKIAGTDLEKVADGYFCNDREVPSGSSWSLTSGSGMYYIASSRFRANVAVPTLSCTNPSDIYMLKAGAITADEVSFAGGVYYTSNTAYYLYNGQYYWTMTPYGLHKGDYSAVFIVYGDSGSGNGHLYFSNTGMNYGIRPVINLKSSTQFKLGRLGTSTSPYEVI